MMIFYIQKCLTMYSFKATKFILTGSLNCWWEPHVSPRVIKVYGRWSSKPNVSVCLRYRLCHPTYMNFFNEFILFNIYFILQPDLFLHLKSCIWWQRGASNLRATASNVWITTAMAASWEQKMPMFDPKSMTFALYTDDVF